MSTLLSPLRSGPSVLSPRRGDRTLSRELDTLDRRKTMAMAELEARAQLESARVHAIGFVGQQALQAAAMLSEMEGQLAKICPLATGRLQGLADITALAIAQVVGEAGRRLS